MGCHFVTIHEPGKVPGRIPLVQLFDLPMNERKVTVPRTNWFISMQNSTGECQTELNWALNILILYSTAQRSQEFPQIGSHRIYSPVTTSALIIVVCIIKVVLGFLNHCLHILIQSPS